LLNYNPELSIIKNKKSIFIAALSGMMVVELVETAKCTESVSEITPQQAGGHHTKG